MNDTFDGLADKALDEYVKAINGKGPPIHIERIPELARALKQALNERDAADDHFRQRGKEIRKLWGRIKELEGALREVRKEAETDGHRSPGEEVMGELICEIVDAALETR